ncbi:MAG: hypothetical protein JW976_13090 [Syntrophaceae bacterium]|nr:hypothetical protein [Syntrophaceae bacterium]
MPNKFDAKESVSIKKLLMSEAIHLKALINLLDKKGIISKRELLNEIKKVKAEKKVTRGVSDRKVVPEEKKKQSNVPGLMPKEYERLKDAISRILLARSHRKGILLKKTKPLKEK